MNGFVLIIPLILIRYLYLYILDKTALKRAAYIPLMIGKQKIAYWIYEFSSLFIIFTPCFLKIIVETSWFIFGLILYSIGVFLCFVSFTNFAKPTKNGINLNGLYKYSRNPIYVAYFIFFLGCSMITQSLLLLSILIIFQIATHFIILAEEKWCIEKFGEEYIRYMEKVRRYL